MNNNIGTDWEEYSKALKFTIEEQKIIDLEYEIIKATIDIREKSKISQRLLSKITGIKQPAISKIEKHKNSPQLNTILKLLTPLGYTLEVVPIDKRSL